MHCWRLRCHWTLSWPQGLSSYPTLLWVVYYGRIPARTVLAACSSPRHSLVPNLDCRHSLLTGPLREPQVLFICLFSCIFFSVLCCNPEPQTHLLALQGPWHQHPNLSRLASPGHSALQGYIVTSVPSLVLSA